MPDALITFIVVAIICGLLLWGLSQFPIDGTIYKLIKIAVVVLLSVMLLNVLLVVLFHKSLAGYLSGGS